MTTKKNIFFRDVFLSHANIDKEKYIKFFVEELEKREISYWLDEAELKWGESLLNQLSEGLSKSRFVIVFISDNFLSRNWTNAELRAALNLEISSGELKVLPILISEPENCFRLNPFMRDKKYLRWNDDIIIMVEELEKALGRSYSKKWLFNYPPSFRGHLWIKIMPKAENKERTHSFSINWGRWNLTGNIDFNKDNSVILDFKKIAEEKSWDIEFEINPPAFVTSGKGNPVIDINKGWKCIDKSGLSEALIKKGFQFLLSDTDKNDNAKLTLN